MFVVLDANVILQARAAGHSYHAILKAWLNRRFSLVASTEIMLEYEEVISERKPQVLTPDEFMTLL